MTVSVAHLRHIPALTEHHLHLLEISSISLDVHACNMSALYRKVRLQPNNFFLPGVWGLSGRNQSLTEEELLSTKSPFQGTIGKSAVILCHSPDCCSLCCTWPLYRSQMVFFFLFILLLNSVLPSTTKIHVRKCIAACKRFFYIFYKRYSIRINYTVLCLRLISSFWLDVIIMELL